MKRIIDGITYDTETAMLIARGDNEEYSHIAPSDACWFLYQTQTGAYFEDAYDHDAAPLGIRPLTKEQARQWLERTANHLVEKHFGTMPEARPLDFSRRTVIAAINVMNKLDHGDLSEFLVNLSNELYKKIPGDGVSKQKRRIELKLFLDENPHYVIGGESLQKLVVEKAVSMVPEPDPWSSPLPENHPTEIFKRALAQDGFEITDSALRRSLPEIVGLPEAENEIVRLLDKHGFTVARGHLDQALDNHTKGNWASANSQIRSFIDGVMDEIAVRIEPSAASLGSGQPRRTVLANKGFLSRDLNEWDDKGLGYINGLMKRQHPHGSHPGLSDGDDCTFRLQTVLIAARLLLVRFDALP